MERPFQAYEGTEPFIFICYAHDDAEQVYPEITRLRDVGFHIWYDEGISPGSEWSATLAEQIQQCTVFLYFVTPQSVEREHCRKELNFAQQQRCTVLAVHLEQTDVPPALQLNLSHRQAILKYENAELSYTEKLDRALESAALGRPETQRQESPLFEIGEWTFDNHCLRRGAEVQSLDPKEASVLLHLVECAPDLVTTDVLLERSWPGMVVGDNALHRVVGRLRRAFGDNARNPRYIETLPKRGYRLMRGVKRVAAFKPESLPPAGEPRSQPHDEVAATPGRIRWPLVAAVGMFVTLLVAIVAWWVRSDEAPPVEVVMAGDSQRVAVMTLRNLTNHPDGEWLAGGLTEELRSEIAGWNTFEVLPGALTRNRSATELAQTADVIIDGYLQGNAEEVTVVLDVISTDGSNRHIKQTASAPWSDPLQLQRQIAGNLSVVFSTAVSTGGAAWRPADAAWPEYLRWVHTGNFGNYADMIYWLERTLEVDPDWTVGWAILAMRHLQMFNHQGDPEQLELANQAVGVASRDPNQELWMYSWAVLQAFGYGNFAEALPVLAAYTTQATNFTAAFYPQLLVELGMNEEVRDPLRRLTESEPNVPGFYQHLSFNEALLGNRMRADAGMARFVELNPPNTYPTMQAAAMLAVAAGDLGAAEAYLDTIEAALQAAEPDSLAGRDIEVYALWVAAALATARGSLEEMQPVVDASIRNGRHVEAALYLLYVGEEAAAEDILDQKLEDDNGYLRWSWFGQRLMMPAALRNHRLVRRVENHLGYTDSLRAAVCLNASSLPDHLGYRCNPEKYAPDPLR